MNEPTPRPTEIPGQNPVLVPRGAGAPGTRLGGRFVLLDRLLKVIEPLIPHAIRGRAIKRAENWMRDHTKGKGGIGAIYPAMANAAIKVKARIREPRCHGVPMEGRAVLATPDPITRGITFWSSTQAPHWNRNAVADALGLSQNQVRCIAPEVGGGFGFGCHLGLRRRFFDHRSQDSGSGGYDGRGLDRHRGRSGGGRSDGDGGCGGRICLTQHDAIFIDTGFDATVNFTLGNAVKHCGIGGWRHGAEIAILGREVAEVFRDGFHRRERLVEALERTGESPVGNR